MTCRRKTNVDQTLHGAADVPSDPVAPPPRIAGGPAEGEPISARIIMRLSQPLAPNTIKIDGEVRYPDDTVDPQGVVFALVPNDQAVAFLAHGGRVTSDGFVTASTVFVLPGVDVRASSVTYPGISRAFRIQIGRLDRVDLYDPPQRQ